MKTITNSQGKVYQQANSGTCYHETTPLKVIDILEDCMKNRTKVRIYCGDIETGKPWNEEHDIIGTVGRSTGSIKIPLLIAQGAYGGPGLLDHCIVKIATYPDKRVLYQHPTFQQPNVSIAPGTLKGYPFETWINGELYGRHASKRSAQICAAKMK